MRSEEPHLDFRLLRKTNGTKTVLNDGFCILRGLAEGKLDHFLGLVGIELRLWVLSRHYMANLHREIIRILSVPNINDG